MVKVLRVVVTGGRHFRDVDRAARALDSIHGIIGSLSANTTGKIALLIHGGARGADAIANAWAHHRNVPVAVFAAEWHLHGKRAGILRNIEMLKSTPTPDLVLAFPGGRGTAHCVATARLLGIPVVHG